MLSSDDFLSRNGSFDSLFNAEVFSILICLVYLTILPYVIAAKIRVFFVLIFDLVLFDTKT